MGNWENIDLNQDQCMYAATDAYVSVFYLHVSKIYLIILKYYKFYTNIICNYNFRYR